MKQTIDLTNGPGVGPREIIFAKPGMFEGFRGHEDACAIIEQSDNHEMHFGCNIKSSGSGNVSICSVEHAQAMIRALQCAIDNDFLFTDEQLNKHHISATDTRRRIKERIRNNEK